MPDKPPAVSVILPTHNRLELFKRALASVLGQSLQDIEVLVIDNACNDGTSEFLAAHHDPRIRVIRLEQKVGASAARNSALRLARAEMLSFQDDDDAWLPTKLEHQMRHLRAAGDKVGLCLAGYVRLTPDGTQDRYHPRYGHIDFAGTHGMLGINAIATPAWLVRRELVERAGGFDEAMPARNDWELALRLSDLCEFTHIPEPLFVQDKRHETSMAFNHAAVTKGVRRVIKIHGHRWMHLPRTRAYHASLIGRYEVTSGDAAEGREWLLKSLRLQPWQPKLMLFLLLSFFGKGSVQRMRKISQRTKARLRAPFKT